MFALTNVEEGEEMLTKGHLRIYVRTGAAIRLDSRLRTIDVRPGQSAPTNR